MSLLSGLGSENVLVSSGSDAVHMWDVQDFKNSSDIKPKWSIRPHHTGANILSATLDPTHHSIYSCGSDGQLFGSRSGGSTSIYCGNSPTNCLAISQTGSDLLFGTASGDVMYYDGSSAPKSISKLESSVSSISYVRDYKHAAAGTETGQVHLFSISHPATTTLTHGQAVTCLSTSAHKASLLASSGQDGYVCVWDALTKGKVPLIRFKGDGAPISSVMFSPNSPNHVFAGSLGRTFSILDMQSQRPVRKVEVDSGIASMDVYGKMVALGGIDGSVTVYDLRRLAQPLFCQKSAHGRAIVTSVSFSRPPIAQSTKHSIAYALTPKKKSAMPLTTPSNTIRSTGTSGISSTLALFSPVISKKKPVPQSNLPQVKPVSDLSYSNDSLVSFGDSTTGSPSRRRRLFPENAKRLSPRKNKTSSITSSVHQSSITHPYPKSSFDIEEKQVSIHKPIPGTPSRSSESFPEQVLRMQKELADQLRMDKADSDKKLDKITLLCQTLMQENKTLREEMERIRGRIG